jgi:hypothetical protein
MANITSKLLVEQSIELSVYSGSVMSVLSGETISRFHWLVVSIESREAKRIMGHIWGQRSADQVSVGTEGLRIVSLLADHLPGDQNNVLWLSNAHQLPCRAALAGQKTSDF